MKPYRWLTFGILTCLVIIVLAYTWATGLMDSLSAYRSPLAEHPPVPGQLAGQALTRRVVFVLIDALRYDTSLKPEVMPFLNELRGQGAWATMHSRPPSYSAPGYSVLMIGAWPDLSDGPAMNPENGLPRTWTQDNVFSVAHRAGLKTAVSGYFWFEGLIPQADVDASFYTSGEDAAADRQVVDAALPWLQSGEHQFILIHIDQVDYAGHHEGGPRSPNWDAAASRADDLLREIVSSLDLGLDTVIVVSDHGQIDAGGHGGQDPIVLLEPLVMAGAGITPGQYGEVDMVDVAPTLAALLGTNIPAAAQGQVLTGMLTLSDTKRANIFSASIAQQRTLYETYAKAMGVETVQISLDPNHYPITIFQSVMTSIKNDRLSRERRPRFVLAFVLALLPASILFLKRGPTVAWLSGGALLYLLLFHLRYAVLDGRTYSLSSVSSADDILFYTATTTLFSFVLTWLVVMIGLRAFKMKPLQAAETCLALTFVTLYLTSLPVLWSFAYNGALVTWTLPDFGSLFLGFLSILQGLVLAGSGLLLTATQLFRLAWK
ncbi:MAG: hypothetical protein Fur0043_12860 [Anaerolineales bacterium]